MKRRRSFDRDIKKIPHKRRRNASETSLKNFDAYQELGHHEGRIKKFSTDYYVTEFIVHHAISFPEEKFKEIFERLIDEAYFKANINKKQVDINNSNIN